MPALLSWAKVDRTAQVLGRRRKTQQWNVTWSRAEANAGQLRYRPELAEGATEVSGFGIWGGAAKPKYELLWASTILEEF